MYDEFHAIMRLLQFVNSIYLRRKLMEYEQINNKICDVNVVKIIP